MEQPLLNSTFQQAIQFHQNGNLPEAEKLYREILNASPGFTAVYANLAELLFRQGNGNAALELLGQGELKFPEDLGILTAQCAFNAQVGNLVRALEYGQKVVQLQPDYADGFYNLGSLFMQVGQAEDAIKAFHRCAELNPANPNAYMNIGVLFFNLRNLPEAGKAFQQAIDASPDFDQAHLNLGIVLTDEGRCEEAAKSFEKALSLNPHNAEVHQHLGMVLHFMGDIKNAISHYEKAFENGKQGPEIHMLLGNGYRDIGELDKAQNHYKKVLAADPDNQEAKSNLQRITSNKINHWHLDMLADTARNDAYYKAILAKIKKGDTVLDIGTGSGLLSMMAVKAGAEKVYACEMVPILADVAKKVVRDNGMSDKIEVFNLKSTALKIGQHLPAKADVVVSEILDCGLLGEGVLPSLRHAYANLLQPGAISVPRSAEVFGVLVEIGHLKKVNPVGEISGFDLSAFEEFRMEDEYQKVHLESLPHQRLSDVFPIHHFDFQNLPAEHSAHDPLRKPISVLASDNGCLHAVAFWFTLHVDESTSLSTGPDGEMIHWGQALYFLKNDRNVDAGEMVDLTMVQQEVLIRFE